eukprot:15438530-Alexandrium_andersonii.AAC.1
MHQRARPSPCRVHRKRARPGLPASLSKHGGISVPVTLPTTHHEKPPCRLLPKHHIFAPRGIRIVKLK